MSTVSQSSPIRIASWFAAAVLVRRAETLQILKRRVREITFERLAHRVDLLRVDAAAPLPVRRLASSRPVARAVAAVQQPLEQHPTKPSRFGRIKLLAYQFIRALLPSQSAREVL
jgi:hypothetical protein